MKKLTALLIKYPIESVMVIAIAAATFAGLLNIDFKNQYGVFSNTMTSVMKYSIFTLFISGFVWMWKHRKD